MNVFAFKLFISFLILGKYLPSLNNGIINKIYQYGGAHSFGGLNG
jgi:hypothetical protein